MKEIKIILKKRLRKIELTATIPETFTELSPEQFKAYTGYVFEKLTSEVFVKDFFGIDKKVLSRMSSYHMFMLMSNIAFIFDEGNMCDKFFLNRIQGTKLIAPMERLNDVSLLQYMLADKLFNKYITNHSLDTLISFSAALYLPKTPTTTRLHLRKRLALLQETDIAASEKLISRNADEITLLAIFNNFLAIRNWLAKRFTFLFSTSSSSSNSKGSGGWLEIFDSFVGDNIGESADFEDMPCMDAFRRINDRIKKYNEYERKRL